MQNRYLIAIVGAVMAASVTVAFAGREEDCVAAGGVWNEMPEYGGMITSHCNFPPPPPIITLETDTIQEAPGANTGNDHQIHIASSRYVGPVLQGRAIQDVRGQVTRGEAESHNQGGELEDEGEDVPAVGSRSHYRNSSIHRRNTRSDHSGDSPITWEHYEGNWTDWLNRDTPGGSGDFEDLNSFIASHGVCSEPSAVECRLRSDGADWSTTGQDYTCEIPTGGICRNDGQSCQDYEVRFNCP